MNNRSRARIANGIVAAAIAAFFLCAHGLLGSISAVVPLNNELAWLAWIGTVVIAVHIALALRVSYEKLTDREKPPSNRKKAKVALRWASGILLGLAICLHIACCQIYGVDAMRTTGLGVFSTIALIVLLATHVSFGAKSLIRDLGGSKETKDRLAMPLRGAVWLVAAAMCFANLAGYIQQPLS